MRDLGRTNLACASNLLPVNGCHFNVFYVMTRCLLSVRCQPYFQPYIWALFCKFYLRRCPDLITSISLVFEIEKMG